MSTKKFIKLSYKLSLFLFIFICPLFIKTEVYAATTDIPIYRLYLPDNGEHLMTSDYNEVRTLVLNHGWTFEGIGWHAPSTGTPVYRLYNSGLGNHLYTTDTNEVKVLTTYHGWTLDNNGKPLFYSGGSVNIYRLYNINLNGMHLLTTDNNEYNTLPQHGWTKEGIKLQATKLGNSSIQAQVEAAVNGERAEHGLLPVSATPALLAASDKRAHEIALTYSHFRPDDTICFTVFDEFNLDPSFFGENIAKGQINSIDVVDAWMHSPGHRANILNPNFKRLGVGYYYNNGARCWVQLFTD